MNTKIYLARHGQDEDNATGILNGHRDNPLTDIGLSQADVLAQTIKDSNLNIVKVFSSPLKRAYVTAEKVSDLLSLPKPQVLDLLIERDFGIVTGQAIKDVERLCAPNIIKTDIITYFLSAEGVETFPHTINRAKELLEWLNKQEFDGNILLVSHGDVGKMIYAAFYNIDWEKILTQFHFGNSEVLLLEEGSKVEDRYVHKVDQHNH